METNSITIRGTKRYPHFVFNGILKTGDQVGISTILTCGFKAYRREALYEIDLYGEMHRFIPVWSVRELSRRRAGRSSIILE